MLLYVLTRARLATSWVGWSLVGWGWCFWLFGRNFETVGPDFQVEAWYWRWLLILINLWYDLKAVTLVKALNPFVRCAFGNVWSCASFLWANLYLCGHQLSTFKDQSAMLAKHLSQILQLAPPTPKFGQKYDRGGQRGIKCAIRQAGIINSEGSHR